MSLEVGNRMLIGDSLPMLDLYRQIEYAAKVNDLVLIRGERGTGKELVARAIAQESGYKGLVVCDITTLEKGTVEAILFGTVKGAFTDAIDKKGLLDANGKNIHLDEIGDMDQCIQAKFLRFVEEGTFKRVGELKERNVDVRLIVTTHKDLEQMTKDKEFREDLYDRLNGATIYVPPLRERSEDIPAIVNYFITEYARRNNLEKPEVTGRVIEQLLKHDYGGNVRELQNILKQAMFKASMNGNVIADVLINESTLPNNYEPGYDKNTHTSLTDYLDGIQIREIQKALDQHKNVKARAAKYLGLNRTTLVEKMKVLGLYSRQNV